MERILYGYIIPSAVAFLLIAVGVYFVLNSLPLLLDIERKSSALEQQVIVADQHIFKDVLQTVLAVAALSIAAFGYGTYKILSSQIEAKVRERIETRYEMSLAHQRTSLGFMNWMLYENSPKGSDMAKGYLDEAIRHTRIAFEEHAVELDEKEHRAERLICDIRNNWAYYVSEKHYMSERYDVFISVSPREQEQFLSFVEWIEERIKNHPDNASDYRDTIDAVRKRLKNSDNRRYC
ncbi:MAG: hypothetical protein OXH22_02345 [Chloroflexi bacterium]|nr:hypothetical protein [Chloroflexota bacterium]